MLRYVIRRILWMIPVILGITLIVMAFIDIAPGDPARIILGNRATEQDVLELREELGLNDPFFFRYYRFVRDALHGNFGN